MTEIFEDDLTEYRADHMTLEELELITAETSFYKEVLKKLMSRGSKVIVGPRGVGKTHHMRIAYKKCLSDHNKPLAIYVTFSRYLRLEPLKNSTAIAIQYFHCWVISKLLLAAKDTLEQLNIQVKQGILDSELTWDELLLFCDQIEKQQTREWHGKLLDQISVSFIARYLDLVMTESNRKHIVLLCDDAALVLTKDYMMEFFDVFRSLKSSRVSPKASVYPNTEFGPKFHLGHDAESVNCWPSIIDDEYRVLFETIYSKRFQTDLKSDIKTCLMYASFGVPRAFINLVSQLNSNKMKTDQQRVNAVIDAQATIIINEFHSLKLKQPHFSRYIQAGLDLIRFIVKDISTENKALLSKGKVQFILGVKQEGDKSSISNKQVGMVVRFLEETGLICRTTPVKHGEGRVYDRYIPHFTLLLAEGAFQRGSAGYITNFTESMSFPREKHPVRRNSFSDYFDKNTLSGLQLDLPNCSNCGEPRINESQKFCMSCGSQLINRSTFDSLIEQKIEGLPLTDYLKETIKNNTNIETVGDIVLAPNPSQELMRAKGIGKIRAAKVIRFAQDWFDEYLS